MNEDLNANNNTGIQGDGKLPDDNNNDLKKSESSLPEAVSQYNKILEDVKQRQSVFGNIGATFICILILLCVFLNIYMVETQKYELNLLKIQQEQLAKEKQAELDKIKLQIAQKNKESADMVIFNDKYLLIRTDYYNKIKAISAKVEDKSNSIEDIIKMTEDRIKLTQDYKSKLNTIAFPAQLTNFYKYETEFIDSDINLWGIVIGYYKLDDLSKFDTGKIYNESNKSHELFIKAREELKNIYIKYELNYFLKDIIIKY